MTSERARGLFAGLRAHLEQNIIKMRCDTNSQTGLEAIAQAAKIRIDILEQDCAALLTDIRIETLKEGIQLCDKAREAGTEETNPLWAFREGCSDCIEMIRQAIYPLEAERRKAGGTQ